MPAKLTKERFIERAKAAHGDKFDYSAVEYVNANTKVTIICPDHGPFQQRPANHFNGFGCAECSGKKQHTTNTFIERAREVHGDKYDYRKTGHEGNNRGVVTITCRTHGDFKQRVNDHLNGFGCPICGGTKKLTTNDFIERARRVHGDKYDYREAKYISNKDKVTIICPVHGPFRQIAKSHMEGRGCERCPTFTSAAEQDLADFVQSLGVPVVQNDRTLLKGKELDIVCPLHGLAIEYNGLYWHSDLAGKHKNYHLAKTQACNAAGFRLIHIFEGDDLEQAKKLIAHALGVNRVGPVYARKCRVSPIDAAQAKAVLKEHHPQGYTSATYHLGTYSGEELVAVTSFGVPFRSKLYEYELKRHVTVRPVIGGLGKAVKHFERKYMSPGEKLGSLCDLSRFDGKSYKAAGFVLDSVLPPDYTYAVGGKRIHKSRYQKSGIARLLPEHYDAGKTEREMMEAAGIGRVYDCGKARYIFIS